MQIIEYIDRDIAAIGVADALASGLKNALLIQDKVSLAVPGGTTPGPIFDVLCAADLDWDRVTIMLTDERWVPEDHERSNTALVKSRLMQGPAAKAQFLPFYRAGETAHEAAPVLSETVRTQMPLSMVVLGMGNDMHTASLFPGAKGLSQALHPDAPALCPIEASSQPDVRITLSAAALKGAMDKHLIIFGQDKRAALEDAMGRPPEEAPIAAVIQGGTVHWAA